MENEEKKEIAIVQALKWTLQEYLTGIIKLSIISFVIIIIPVVVSGLIFLTFNFDFDWFAISTVILIMFWTVFWTMLSENYRISSGKKWRGI